jgi:hypothetical protein
VLPDSAVPEHSGLLLASNPGWRGKRVMQLHHGLRYYFREPVAIAWIGNEVAAPPNAASMMNDLRVTFSWSDIVILYR